LERGATTTSRASGARGAGHPVGSADRKDTRVDFVEPKDTRVDFVDWKMTSNEYRRAKPAGCHEP
jgi:hypothetical protein